MSVIEIVAIVVGALLTPFVLYLGAKLVTYGILAGRDRFERDKKERERGAKS